ncbi:hypothetical protein C2845_PM09G23630 [Panicum miliaceum]|uniref:Protein FAR1-RELATED SEQUENCE n=1 Tax=Panicum miliaceum TaxID=4540 RepID=A0A3L6S3V2_PANMI|nr:hypothetical protein C2845_PM09G23630 [Panicum miliaceum]
MKRDGIVCCHILKIMTQVYIDEILKSTCYEDDEAPKGAENDPENENTQPKQQQSLKTIRYADLCNEFGKIANEASTNEKTTKIVRKHLIEIRTDVVAFKTKNSKRQKIVASQDNTNQNQSSSMHVNDPPTSKLKGWQVSTRIKPGFNLQANPKNIKCHICGSNEHTTNKCDNRLGKK